MTKKKEGGLADWKIWTVVVLSIFFPLNLFAQSEEVSAKQENTWSETMYTKYIKGKMSIGTRFSYRYLTDSDSGNKGGTYGSGTYLGTIYALDEIQDYWPDKFFLTYYFTRYFGFELAYDSIEAGTIAWNTSSGTTKTDGDVSLLGPTISLLARYPNRTDLTPYLGVGLSFYSGDFDEDSDWAYSDWGTSDRNRYMEVDDTTAVFVNAGLTWQVNDNWFVDSSLQYLYADPDATFYGYTDGVCDTAQSGHFPLSNVSLRLGIGYSF